MEKFLAIWKKNKPCAAIDMLLMKNTQKKIWFSEKMIEFLKENIPELYSCTLCQETPPYHKAEPTYTHIIRTVYNAPKNIMIRRAALFHDIGKPHKRTRDKKGTHFYGHQVLGAAKAYKLMTRLGYSKEEAEKAVLLIKNHMRPKIYGMRGAGEWSDKAVIKYVDDLQGYVMESIELAIADTKGSSDLRIEREKIKKIRELKKRVVKAEKIKKK